MNKKILLSGLLIAALFITAFYVFAPATVQPDLAQANPQWNAEQAKEWYRKKSINLPDDALDNITDEMVQEFIAASQPSGAEVTPQETKELVINSRLTVLSPAVDEAQMDQDAKVYKLEYAICHLNSATLGLLNGEYRGDFTAVLNDLGVQQQCAEGLCGYAVGQGALLELAANYGLQVGDGILAVNGVAVADMQSFDALQASLLSRQQSVQLQVQRNGLVEDLAPVECAKS